MDQRVEAIRNSKLVGKGSCSSIDECYGESDLVELFDTAKLVTTNQALYWALKHELLWREQELNCLSGEEPSTQNTIDRYKQFKAAVKVELAALLVGA